MVSVCPGSLCSLLPPEEDRSFLQGMNPRSSMTACSDVPFPSLLVRFIGRWQLTLAMPI